jgi:sterol desaturase/sphingolipid hydroxylase (fatty acid hydroxylase superfamily)
MIHTIVAILEQLATVTLPALRNLAVLAMVFTLLGRFFGSCNPGAPWWRKPDLATDICFALVPRLFNMYAQVTLLVVGIALIYGIHGPDDLAAFLTRGVGPLAGLPFWEQVGLYLIGNDLMMYLTHRAFHTMRLWRFHAIHHSSEDLEWTSATRFHPIDQAFHGGLSDVVMLLLGIPPDVLVWLAPWSVGTSALVHANLNWDFGPFRYVLASPVYHRWHHTSADRGGSSNFAGTFPVFDLIFGTFHMPRGVLPDAYGQDDATLPKDFLGQLVHPFRRRQKLPLPSWGAAGRGGSLEIVPLHPSPRPLPQGEGE